MDKYEDKNVSVLRLPLRVESGFLFTAGSGIFVRSNLDPVFFDGLIRYW